MKFVDFLCVDFHTTGLNKVEKNLFPIVNYIIMKIMVGVVIITKIINRVNRSKDVTQEIRQRIMMQNKALYALVKVVKSG